MPLLRHLILLTFLTSLLLLVSCDGTHGNNHTGHSGGAANETVRIPKPEDIEREFTKFDDIVYSRPDYEKLISDIDAVAEKIKANDTSFEEQVALIEALETDYSHFLTMYSYNIIAISKNAADSAVTVEYELLASAYPDVLKAIEDMTVAAARSPHARKFEEEYFGDGLIEEYGEGGKYTEEIVALLKNEAELETKYSSISTATVDITYDGVTASFDEMEQRIANKYGEGSTKYISAMADCEELYYEAENRLITDTFVDLLRVRRLIADEFSYESYATYAYDTIYHDYSTEQMDKFIDDIAKYVVPVYKDLESTVFYSYFRSVNPPSLSRVKLINTLYDLYEKEDEELHKIYSYMLASGFYDIDYYDDNRSGGAFTTYLEDYSAPFIFMTRYGDVGDLTTLSHEFGHFADSYINYDSVASMDLLEVSSQALELLTLEMLSDTLTSSEYKYLLYYEIQNAFLTLIYQGFYASFEREVYQLAYDEITEENLAMTVSKVAREMGLPQYDLSVVFIDHTLLYPFYVQSYCTSIVSSIDIYLEECDSNGAGIEIYKNLIERSEELTYEQNLLRVGLSSPFEKDKLKEISNELYYKINGYYYFKESQGNSNVA